MTRPKVIIWTVYEFPTDYPDSYVARRFEVDRYGSRPTAEILVKNNIDDLRMELEGRGLINLSREDNDDPRIVESWI